MQPALGLDVRNRRQLLEKLREYDREGLGGVLMSEVKEALPNPEKAVQVRGEGQCAQHLLELCACVCVCGRGEGPVCLSVCVCSHTGSR